MTVEKLQLNVVLPLANSGWCRYWLDFAGCKPVQMAVQLLDEQGKPQRIRGIEEKGFSLYSDGNPETAFIYIIPRTNEDGTCYTSLL